MRFSEAEGRFSHGQISRATCFFSVISRGPVAEGPPKHCVKKTWVENGLDGVLAVSAFLVIFRTFLRQKTRRYTFSRHLPYFLNKSTANGLLQTDHETVVSIFQRLTLRIPAGRPFPLFQSGPGWPSSYVYHMTTAGSLGGQLKCDSQSINQSIATENTPWLAIQLHSCLWVQT